MYGAAHGYAPDYITIHPSGYTDISYVRPVTSSLCRQPHLQRIRGFAFMRYINPRLTLTFNIPRTRTRMSDCALMVAGPRAWNTLPADICCALSLDTFKKLLKSHLFSAAYEL